MFREVEEEFKHLPPQFFGKVEITFQLGLPTFIRVTRDIKLNPKLNSVGTDDNRHNK